MHDQIGFAREQPFERPAHGLEMQIQARARMIREKPAQQRQHRLARTDVTHDDVERALLAHRQLCRERAQHVELAQQRLRAPMKSTALRREPYAVAGAVEQDRTELPLETRHGGKNGRMGAMQFGRSRLEPAGANDGVETLQIVQREVVHEKASEGKTSGACGTAGGASVKRRRRRPRPSHITKMFQTL